VRTDEPTLTVATAQPASITSEPAPVAKAEPTATPAPSAIAPTATSAPDSSSSASTTVSGLAGESLAGFSAGSSVTVRVSGSRTIAQFVLPRTVGTIDTAALVASLQDSAARQALAYAQVETAFVSTAAPANTGVPIVDPADLQRFTEEELDGVEPFAVSGASAMRNWLVVNVSVAQYVPGSRVYLVITSDPLIIDSAIVSNDGTARLSGAVPLEVLGEGAHRLRVVGSRQLGGIVVNAQGEIHVPDAALREVETFDHGTTAVVEITGVQRSGGVRTIVRYIPLRGEYPWWLLVAVLIGDLGAGLLRKRGHLVFARRRWLALAGLTLAAVSASWLGWLALWPEVVPGCALLLILGAFVIVRSRSTAQVSVAAYRY
jgi:hypothetical protein